MKIRCKNCYRVLGPQEEYCKGCGTHSEAIANAMKTGDYGGGISEKLKVSLIIYLIIAFIGTGIMMIAMGSITEVASESLFNKSNAVLVTAILSAIVLYVVNLKNLKDYFWNGNLKQLLGSIAVIIIFMVMFVLLSKMSKYTRVIPMYITDYLKSGKAKFLSGTNTNILFLALSMILVILTEELLFRRLLIDFFDEQTMLNDFFIVLFSALIGTILDFAWLMSTETLICSFLLNILMSGLYINTNRSLIVNVVTRIIIVAIQFILFLI